jgi:excisionase family DNA binding protein
MVTNMVQTIESIDTPLLVDFKTAARLIGVGVSTFYAMDRSGELGPQGIRLRRRRLWPREELAAWVRAGCPRRELWEAMSKDMEECA